MRCSSRGIWSRTSFSWKWMVWPALDGEEDDPSRTGNLSIGIRELDFRCPFELAINSLEIRPRGIHIGVMSGLKF